MSRSIRSGSMTVELRSNTSALLRSFKPFVPTLGKILAFSVVLNLLVLTVPLYMMQVYDRVIPTKHQETLLFLSLIALAAIALYTLLDMVRIHVLIKLGHQFTSYLRPKLLFACVRAGLSGMFTGTRPVDELDTMRLTLTSPAFLALFDLPWLALFVIIIWLVHPVLGAFAVSAVVILALSTAAAGLIIRKNIAVGRKADANADRYALAITEHASTVMGMHFWQNASERWQGLHVESIRKKLPAELQTAGFASLTKGLRTLVQIGTLGVGAYLAIHQEITVGAIIAVSILLNRALAPVDALVSGWRQCLNALQLSRQIQGLLHRFPEADLKSELPALSGHLTLERVTYCPAGQQTATLSSISLEISPGQIVAIVGPSGAGKTTLCKLLSGSMSTSSGDIRIDGARLADWNEKDLFRDVGYVSQKSEFLPGTVTQNISRFQENREADAIEAARLAGVHDLILSLPKGYLTKIDKDGKPFSGGQQQRLALARAIFGKPKLLIFDEPNANLDAEGMLALTRILSSAKAWGATVMMAVHSTSLFSNADKILVLERGRVAAFGSRDEILARMRSAASAPDVGEKIDA